MIKRLKGLLCFVAGHKASYCVPIVVARHSYGGIIYADSYSCCDRCSRRFIVYDDSLPKLMPTEAP